MDRSIGFGIISHAKFGSYPDTTQFMDLRLCDTLKRLYMVHHGGDNVKLLPPYKLEKLVFYCPESGEDPINATKFPSNGLNIVTDEHHTIEEM
jgi:hypothetical protein